MGPNVCFSVMSWLWLFFTKVLASGLHSVIIGYNKKEYKENIVELNLVAVHVRYLKITDM